MTRIDYEDTAAAAFQASCELPPDALSEWRTAIARHLAPWPGMRLLDLGVGTGGWAAALANWYGIAVVAVEPSPAMRARARYRCTLAGEASALPLAPATVDGAWLSTVIRHLPDLPAAARELRRVLRPGARSSSAAHSPAATTASNCSATGQRPQRSSTPSPASPACGRHSPQPASATWPWTSAPGDGPLARRHSRHNAPRGAHPAHAHQRQRLPSRPHPAPGSL